MSLNDSLLAAVIVAISHAEKFASSNFLRLQISNPVSFDDLSDQVNVISDAEFIFPLKLEGAVIVAGA